MSSFPPPSEFSLHPDIVRCIREGGSEAESLLLDLNRWQTQRSRTYGNFARTFPIPRHWREIPAVPSRAFKFPDQPLTCFPHRPSIATFLTSGTTTEEKGEHHFPFLDLYHLALREAWQQIGPASSLRPLFLTPSAEEWPHSSLSHMFSVLGGKGAPFLVQQGKFHLAPLLRSEEPLFLMGTVLAFLNLMDRHGPIPLPPGSFLLNTGGAKGVQREIPPAELYQRLSDYFSVPEDDIYSEYGMTELSSQAYARGSDGLHRFPAWCRIAVTCPATGADLGDEAGAEGYLRIYDLANAYSVCGVQTQDLVRCDGEGRFKLLGRDPDAVPRGCSRAAEETLKLSTTTVSAGSRVLPLERPRPAPGLDLIASFSSLFTPWTGEFDAARLQQWKEDEFAGRSPLLPHKITHILSGNTPHAAWQSLLAGLTLGARNLVKLPSMGLEGLEASFPVALQPWVEFSRTLPPSWLWETDAVTVYGSDQTIADLRSQVPPELPFVGHGHRAGVAVITRPDREAARLAAQDVCDFEQRGCLSLQTIFTTDPHSFGPLLLEELEKIPLAQRNIRPGNVTNTLWEMSYLATQAPSRFQVWKGQHSVVVFHSLERPEASPGARTVFLQHLDLFTTYSHYSGVAYYPPHAEISARVPRLFPLGEAQRPPFGWAHDGMPSLASLVRFQTHT